MNAADHKLHAADHKLQDTKYKLQDTNHKMHAADRKLQDTKHNIFSHHRDYIHYIYIYFLCEIINKYISSEP